MTWSRGGDLVTVSRNGRPNRKKYEPCARGLLLPKQAEGCVFHPVTITQSRSKRRCTWRRRGFRKASSAHAVRTAEARAHARQLKPHALMIDSPSRLHEVQSSC